MEDDNYNVAMSVKDMLQQLPTYMADRLCEEFKKNEGDYKVWKYRDNFCGVYFEKDIQYKIDIWTSELGYVIYVFGQNQVERIMDWTVNLNSLKEYGFVNENGREYKKDGYKFNQENDVIKCVYDIISEIKKYLNDNKK